MLIIRDIMTRSPVTVAPQVTLRAAAEILARYGISGMPVVDGRAIIGTLSARDIVDFESTLARIRCSGTPEWDQLADHVVADAMSPVTTTFRPSDPAEKAARYMERTGAHRAVIAENGVLIGILSTVDITRVVAERARE